jgi:DNA-binding MarR family transcriptional regulator
VFRIFLTKKGESLKTETAKCAAQSIKDALKGLSKSEIENCTHVLLKIKENVG